VKNVASLSQIDMARLAKTHLEDAAHILVVDQDPGIRQTLARCLAREGYGVSLAANSVQMRALLATNSVDLIFLEAVMPGEDALTLAREIRGNSFVGIIVLTGPGDVVDRVACLKAAADDFLAKPFRLREIPPRVKGLLRRRRVAAKPRAPASSGDILRFDGWSIDLARRRLVSPRDREVALTTREFDLLAAFVTHPGRVLNRNALMDLTRGQGAEAFDRTVDAQVTRLRKKIEADPKNPTLVKSVRGVGYVFAAKIDE
jgi:two-component system, OmpR family, response regulator